MARTKKITLNTRTSRRSIPIDSDTLHIQKLQQGLALGYRKGIRGGSWTARRHEAGTRYSFEPLGTADDQAPADGITVLSFDQAQVKARQWFAQKAAEDTGEVVANYTVADACADYVSHLIKEKRKPQYRTETIVKAFILPSLGTVKLSELTHGKVKAWRDALAKAAPRTCTGEGKQQNYRTVNMSDPEVMRKRQASVNRILTVLKAALNLARAEQKVSSKVAWEAVKPFRRTDVPKVRFLTLDEVTALVENCEPHFQMLVKGALLTGARCGELTALKVSEFNPEDGRIYIADSKNGEPRHVDLNENGVALFKELTQDREPSEHMFLKSTDNPWNRSGQKKPIDDACAAAGIKGVTFHILRHTYASHAVMNGMPIEVLAEVLGHKDTRITMRHYAHLCQTYKQKLVRANAPSFGFTGVPNLPDKPFIVQPVRKRA